MNRRNMKISKYDGKMTILYDCGVIQKVEVKDRNGCILFYLPNGESFVCDVSAHILPEIIYLHSFGVSVAENGSCFFIQSWERGLFCFALPSGMLLWRSNRKKADELIVRHNAVLCRFVDQCVDKMDILSGKVMAHYPLGWATNFYPLDDNYYLAGPKRGKYHLLDHCLQIQETISYEKLNPALLDTCIIVDVEHVPGGMIICGFEYMDDYYQEQKLMRNTDMEQYRFSRFVPLDCFQLELDAST